jgi:hypothetical protein
MPTRSDREEAAGGSNGLLRRDFLRGSALTAGTMLAATLAENSQSEAAPAADDAKPLPRKTFLAVGAHMDDAELGAGGVLIQAARAGHRVVIVTVVSDYRSWLPTVGR